MSKKKVLVIDDEESIRELMDETLEGHGYHVFSAANGVDGLKIASQESVDIIVLDLNMPRMDGYMFLEHLNDRWEKEARRGKFPEILVLTAVEKEADFGLAKNLGASRVMNKPFKPKDFLAAIKELST